MSVAPISAANWRAAVAFSPATLELMARAYLGLGEVPLVEFDGDEVVAVRTTGAESLHSPRRD